jgi:hypothetical protein
MLLVLDGLEPLQNPPGVEGGKLKDPALSELLRHLETDNPGLCLITTRLEVADIADWRHATAPVIDLRRLSSAAGSALLEAIGVRGDSDELAEAVNAVDGHALTLNLLGTYVRDILDRDVRRWREAGLLESARQGDHRALQVMAAYERWFSGRPELAILRILGLFDRPVGRDLVDVLRKPPVIAGLNDDVVSLPENEWRWALARLRQAHLIEDEAGGVIDTHPLVREHFGERLRKGQPEPWGAGHGRLYEHLRDSAKPLPDTLPEMAPLFQAMHHGCQAGRHEEALNEVYWKRVLRDTEAYSTTKLGAFSAEMAALANLFDSSWSNPVATLTEVNQALIMNEAAYNLRALGRLREAVTPMRASLDRLVAQKNEWKYAARAAGNCTELHLKLGDVAEAVETAKAAVTHADRSTDIYECVDARTILADALHQAGEPALALALFREAEALQSQHEPAYPRLYSFGGYLYCDLLLAEDQAAEVLERAEYSLQIAKASHHLLRIAVNHLSLGLAALALAKPREARAQLDRAVDGLREAGEIDELPRGLLARAALFRETDSSAARCNLDETMRIARRGKMRLYQCDAHLEYARVALAEGDEGPARKHVAEARELVEDTGYGRRRPEVEELEQML